MGQRLCYFRNNSGKKIKDLLSENFSEFRQWYLDMNHSSIDEFNEPYGIPQLIGFLERESKFDLEKLDKNLVDGITAGFMDFVDTTDHQNQIFQLFGPLMNKWRYNSSYDLIINTGDTDLIRLWNFLIRGRSLKDSGNFESFSDDYSVGVLSSEEQKQLRTLITGYFGDIEEIKDKYWTEKEKWQYQESMRNITNGLGYLPGDHRPVSTGIELVLQVLNEIKDCNTELVTGIE